MTNDEIESLLMSNAPHRVECRWLSRNKFEVSRTYDDGGVTNHGRNVTKIVRESNGKVDLEIAVFVNGTRFGKQKVKDGMIPPEYLRVRPAK